MGAMAADEGERTEGGRGVRPGAPDGRTAGAGGNRQPDGAGVSGTRSGGSGTAAVHPADTGAAGGRLGESGTDRSGTQVPENDAGVSGVRDAAPTMDQKNKLALAPPPPSWTLDVPQSRRWHDGSGLIITSGVITLLEAGARYSTNRCSTALSLVGPTGTPDTA